MEIYEEILTDIIFINNKFDLPLILIGDFNSRTGHLDDFPEDDNLTGDHGHMNLGDELLPDGKQTLINLGVPYAIQSG